MGKRQKSQCVCWVENKERGWTELGEEKGRQHGGNVEGVWTGEVAIEMEPRGDVRVREATWETQAYRWTLKAVVQGMISQAVSKHQDDPAFKSPGKEAKRRNSGMSALFASYTS